jgi:hypothetical protein
MMRVGFGYQSSQLSFWIFVLGCNLFRDNPFLVHAAEFVQHTNVNSDGKLYQGTELSRAASQQQHPATVSKTGASAVNKPQNFSGATPRIMADRKQWLLNPTSALWNRAGKRVPTNFFAWVKIVGGAEDENDRGTADDGKASRSGAFLGHLDGLRRKSLNLPEAIIQRRDPILQRMKSAADVVQQTGTRAIPSAMTTLTMLYAADRGITPTTLYALALLGASCGFHLFLYFITIGYALGIGLPTSVALHVYNVSQTFERHFVKSRTRGKLITLDNL